MKGTKQEIRPGVWRCRVFVGMSDTGSPRYVSKNIAGGIRAANKALAQMVTDLDTGKLKVGSETISDLMVRWLEHCETKGLSPTTVREHRRIVAKNVMPVIGSIKVTKLRASDLDHLYASMVARGVKPATVRRTHAVIGAALKQGTKWDVLDNNVALKASPPSVYRAEVSAPGPDEVRAMIAEAEEAEPVFASLLALSALTGARRGELCGLQWSDVDWKACTLTICRSVHESPGGGYGLKSTKTHAVRTITLDPVAIDILKDHRTKVEDLTEKLGLAIGPDAFMFSRSPQGLEPIQPNYLSKFVTRMSKRAGLNFHLHQIRHYAATQAIGAGYDPTTVAARLGHADSSITLKVYSHSLEHRDAALAATLGNILAG